jgi:hypothetical protein
MSVAENPVSALLRAQLQTAHGALEGTLQGVTAEQAHWAPPGRALPIAAHYAHVVAAEDFFVNVLFQGSAPIARSTMEGKTGISEPPTPGDWSEWARRVQLDLPQAHDYATAVYAATDAFLASATPDELNRMVDASAIGLGERSVGSIISAALLNAAWHCGEISCLKGQQGEKGYPF